MIDIIDNLGETRFLMPLESLKVTKTFKVFGDEGSAPLVPRSDWKPVSLATFTPPVKDQDGIGACNAFATVNTVEIARAMSGLEYAKLSPGYLYGSINGQRDQGSMLEDAIAWMQEHGTCLAATVPELAWKKSQWPSNAATEAKQYRVLEWWQCPTFEHVVSAILRGFAVNIGVMWGNADNPDADGWLPDRVTAGGGHSICRCTVENRNGVWGVGGPNSWSAKWGKDGWMVFSEKRMVSEQSQFGWFATRATTFPSDQGVPQPK